MRWVKATLITEIILQLLTVVIQIAILIYIVNHLN